LTRWLLNTFPTWALSLLGVGCSATVAAAGLLLVRKRFPGLMRAQLNEVAGIAIGVLAAIYGIILGFVIVSLYEGFQAAAANVQAASAELIQLYEDTSRLPIAGAMKVELRTYVADVRFREFPLMRDGRGYARIGDKHIGDMYRVLASYNPTTPSQTAFYNDAVARLNDVVASRLRRLFDASEQIPTPFAALLLVGGALLVAALWLLDVASLRLHLTLVLAVTVILSLSVILAIELDNPFSGGISVSSRPFAQDKLADLHATPADVGGP